jgi:hypothetical protein
MPLDTEKYREALVGLGPVQPVFVDPPSGFRVWLAQKRVPSDVIEFLVRSAVAADVPFPSGSGGIWPPNDIILLNEDYPNMLAAGLLAIGNAANGDFLVIDLRDDQRQAGYVGHDELFEKVVRTSGERKEWHDVREIFAPVTGSLDEMLAGLSADLWKFLSSDSSQWSGRYPRDYSDAVSRN